ncbi:MAG TPA: tetratricopeptide repeat protein [Vicinamibacterales bacterium]|nr:tetratricopeptide repeat protein [Vicinamibacterales bacterium]
MLVRRTATSAKWAGAAVALVTCTVLGAVAVQGLYAERQYRRLLADGDRALGAGNAYGAIEAFSGALAFRPDSMVAYLRRGEAYRDQRRFEEAARDWRQASRLAPDAPQPLIALGEHFDALGQYAQAAEWYGQAAARLKAEDPSLLYKLALARFKAGDSGAAIEPLKAVASRNDFSAERRYLLGLVQRDVGDLAGSIASLEGALALAPDLNAAREELADAYRAAGRPMDEMIQLQALGAREPHVNRSVAIADAEARRGQFDSALGVLSNALTASPNDSGVLLAIGRVHLARAERHPEGAEEFVRRALETIERALGGTAPRSEGLALYGRALSMSGNYSDAERILKDAVATSPVSTEAFLYLADAAERLGHDLIARDALISFDSLLGDTSSVETRSTRAARIGDLSLKAGDAVMAGEFLSRAVAGGHASPLALGLLAQARWLTGDQASARDLIGRALSASPKDAQLQRIARTIR